MYLHIYGYKTIISNNQQQLFMEHHRTESIVFSLRIELTETHDIIKIKPQQYSRIIP